MDPLRIPKDGFFAHKVMWDGWVDVETIILILLVIGIILRM